MIKGGRGNRGGLRCRWKYGRDARCGERSWNDRHRSLRGNRLRLSCREADNTPPPCGFLSSRASGQEPAALTTPHLRAFYETRKKKRSRTFPIARQRLTRLFVVRPRADNVGSSARARCAISPCVTFDAIETYCASGYEPNRFRNVTNVSRRTLFCAP